MAVQLTGFPMCCGADVVCNFVATTMGSYLKEEDAVSDLLETVNQYAGMDANGRIEYKKLPKPRNRLRLCILSHSQATDPRLAYLKRLGFQFVTRFYNDNHSSNGGVGSLCYLFMRVDEKKKPYPVSASTPPPGWETVDITPPKKPELKNPFEKA